MIKRLLFLVLLLLLGLFAEAQEQKINEYYIVPENEIKIDFEKTEDRIIFNTSVVSINNFFNKDVNVKKIEKAFPTSQTKYLQKIYLVTLNETNQLESIRNLKGIEDAYLREEAIELSTPNDYIDFDNNKRNTALELIRAPLAWSITTGNPNIAVGISDATFDKNHEELVGKIIFDNNTSYSTIFNHGSRVAGIATGNTNNGLGSSWIGYNSKLAISSHSYNAVLLLSQVPGVRVINISMLESCQYNPIAAAVYQEVWEGNTIYPPVVIVAAAGNGSTAGHINWQGGGWCNERDNNGNIISWNGYVYPASYDHVISVGAVSHMVQRYSNDPALGSTNWEDLILNNVSNQYSYTTFNDKVNIFAPGFRVLVAGKSVNNSEQINGYSRDSGTSLSSPMVAGTAALVLSVNPDLTSDDVKDILINTADPIFQHPENATFINENGPGRLNAFRAVLTAKCMAEPNNELDLMIRDNFDDFGQEPNNSTQDFHESIDMWIRNQPDGKNIRDSENPHFVNNNSTVYVYVRVTNKSCVTSTGNEKVKLYWAKASTSLNWPNNWDGSTYMLGRPMGGEIGELNIPSLQPGEDTIIEFEWNNVPNPALYEGINSEPWHFCLLSRIISDDDPMKSPETAYVAENVKNNNNIAWKNISIINVNGSSNNLSQGAVIMVGNPFNLNKKMKLKFYSDLLDQEQPIYKEAEVKVKLDNILFKALDNKANLKNIEPTDEEGVYIIKGEDAYMDGINLEPNEMGTLYLSFNFLSREATEKNTFKYKVVQYDDNEKVLGGETYIINKEYNNKIEAFIHSNQNANSLELASVNLYDNAIYNWYDSVGDLIYSGSDFVMLNSISDYYKLEITSTIDGFKDYAEIIINGNSNTSLNIYPNPSNTTLNIDYDLQGTSGYINITNISNNSISNNYILNSMNNTIAIDVSNYSNGYYNVTFVKNGSIYKSSIFIKN